MTGWSCFTPGRTLLSCVSAAETHSTPDAAPDPLGHTSREEAGVSLFPTLRAHAHTCAHICTHMYTCAHTPRGQLGLRLSLQHRHVSLHGSLVSFSRLSRRTGSAHPLEPCPQQAWGRQELRPLEGGGCGSCHLRPGTGASGSPTLAITRHARSTLRRGL